MKKITEHKLNIQKDYQYRALHRGIFFQRQWHRNRLLLVEYLSFLSPNDNVADVGCGSGNVVLRFNNQVKQIIGFDYNNEALKFLLEKLKENNISNASVSELDILNNISQKHRSFFDKIIFNEIIEHFDEKDVKKVLANLKLMLKNDGEILITTPNYQLSPWPILEFLIDKFNIYPSLWGEQHKTKFTPQKLCSLCKENGLSLVQTGTFGLFSPFLAVIGHTPADFIARAEIKHLKLFGPQIYAVFKKS